MSLNTALNIIPSLEIDPMNVLNILPKSNRNAKAIGRRQVRRQAIQFEFLEDRTVPSGAQSSIFTVGAGHEYSTISAALTAAAANPQRYPNPTIEVFPGTYQETVTISENGVSLIAEKMIGSSGSAMIQPMTVTPVTLDGVNIGGAAIDITGRAVVVSGFVVDGSKDTDTNLWAGIRVIEGGSATIENNHVTNMRYGNSASNVGIQVGTSLVNGTPGSGTATVNSNAILSYAGVGVLVDGVGASATVTNNTITGLGTANNGATEYGVQVSNGGAAQVKLNTITGNTISGSAAAPDNPPFVSAGIFFVNEGANKVLASGNTLTGNDVGVLVQSSTGTKNGTIAVNNNRIERSYGYAGIFVSSSSEVQIADNLVADNITLNGIALNNSNAVLVQSNTIFSNGVNGSETDGIYDYMGSSDPILSNNVYSNSGNGINIQSSTSDIVSGNLTKFNTLSGIQDLDGTNDSILSGQSVDNAQNGVVLNGTTGDSITRNVLSGNRGTGVQLIEAQNTLIVLNTLRLNTSGTITMDSQTHNTTELLNS